MPGDVVGEVTFLVDTGAASSVLMAGDVIDLGIDWNALPISPHTYIGAGGIARSRVASAFVIFEEIGVGTHVYWVPELSVFEPDEEFQRAQVPSLLGRDILNRWEMLYNPSEDRLELRVKSADYSLTIQPDVP